MKNNLNYWKSLTFITFLLTILSLIFIWNNVEVINSLIGFRNYYKDKIYLDFVPECIEWKEELVESKFTRLCDTHNITNCQRTYYKEKVCVKEALVRDLDG